MSDRTVFNDSILPLPEESGFTHNGLIVNNKAPEHLDEKMSLLFSLPLNSTLQSQLEERVAKGEVVPYNELKKNYSADPTDRDALIKWLKGQGFEIESISDDGTSVYAQASVAQIEKSLDVNMTRVTKDGISYTAAQNAPSLPSEIGKNVRAIVGLQPYRHAQKHFRRFTPLNDNRWNLLEQTNGKSTSLKQKAGRVNSAKAKQAVVPSPNVQNAPPYLTSEILKAYNADGLSVTGKGQTIAILIDTFPDDKDLKAFWKSNNSKTSISQVQKINVKNVALPPAEGEETLDVSWTSGIAQGANIRVYASGSLQFVDLDKALDRIIADLPSQAGMHQMSISLGLGETYMSKGEAAAQHQKFLFLAASGVNIFVSSGDAGSNPDSSGHSSNGPTQVEYESSDPNVIGVGGTTLKLTSVGSVGNESAWSSSGGGKSVLFPRPVWQVGTGIPAGSQRLVPDVSLTADPNQGAFLVLHGKVVQMGGTSWSAPVWAGFCALINEARVRNKKPPLPFLNPLIYPLIGTACFRDIQNGTNGAYKANKGYDMITGIGVPNVSELIKVLTI